MHSMDLQLRRRAGIPRKTRNAKTAPPPAPSRPLPPAGLRSSETVAAVVVTESVPLPDVLEALSEMVPLGEQLGRFEAPLGELVSEQLSETVPA